MDVNAALVVRGLQVADMAEAGDLASCSTVGAVARGLAGRGDWREVCFRCSSRRVWLLASISFAVLYSGVDVFGGSNWH